MNRLGLRVPNEIGGHYSMDAVVDLASRADGLGYESVWVPESAARNSLMVLSRLATVTDSVRLGTGIVNVFSRSPALLAMSAATLDEFSDGRAMLGIGASSRPLIENWHAMEFDRPLRRIRETIEIVDAALSDPRVDYDGKVFRVDDYPNRLETVDGDVPIYNAALGPRNRELTGRFADGWLPIHLPLPTVSKQIAGVREAAADADRDPERVTVAPYIVTCASADDPEGAREVVSGVLAFYIGAMEYYAGVFRRFGYEETVDRIVDAWAEDDRGGASETVAEGLLDEVAIAGTPDYARRRLREYRDAGVDVPIVALPAAAPRKLAVSTVEALGPG